MTRSFQHSTPALRVFQGEDCLRFLPRELERLGCRRAVLVCGATLARDTSLIGQVLEAAGERCGGLFAGVRAHSPEAAVAAAAAEMRRLGADAAVALGGGSAIVTARAASILLAEGGRLAALASSVDGEGRLRSPKLLAPKIPLLVIPTTPTTAMPKAGSAVLDGATGERRALFDPKTRAQAIFLHPGFLLSAPRALVLGAALNAFAMAAEGLTSTGGDPLADALLMHALRLTARHLSGRGLDQDAAARAELALAALMSGQGTDVTGGGVTTAMGHLIGARHHVENGIVNAIMLPHALRFSAAVTRPGLEKIAAALGIAPAGEGLAETVIAALARILAPLGLPQRLGEIGVPRESLAGIAALGMADWFLRGNPRPIRDAAELTALLEAAW